MTETTNPLLADVDREYAEALAEWLAAKTRYRVAGAARERMHLMAERQKSTQMQALRGMSDEEWAALRQSVDSPMPFNATVVHDQ